MEMPGANKSWLDEQAEKLVQTDILNEVAYEKEQIRLRKEAQQAYMDTMNSLQARMSQQIVDEIDKQILEQILALADPVPDGPKKTTLNTSLDLIHSSSIIAKPAGMIYIPDDIEKLIVVPNAIEWIMGRHKKSNELSRLHRRAAP